MESNTKKSQTFSMQQMTLTALMTAVICCLGPLSLPIPTSPVPISLTNLAIFLTSCILGSKLGTISYILYLIMGLIGLPVFSGFSSGFGKLFGPTGGYLIGMIFTAMICGLAFERLQKPAAIYPFLILGTAVSYLTGTIWLCYQANLSFMEGLLAGVIPYIPGDLIKMLIAVLVAPAIKKRLTAAGLLNTA